MLRAATASTSLATYTLAYLLATYIHAYALLPPTLNDLSFRISISEEPRIMQILVEV